MKLTNPQIGIITCAALVMAIGIQSKGVNLTEPVDADRYLSVDVAEIRGRIAMQNILRQEARATIEKAENEFQKTKQLDCLAKIIWSEGRGESRAGQKAIGQVVLNRVNKGIYGDTICKVVHYKRGKTYHFSANDPRDVNYDKAIAEFNKSVYSKSVVTAIDIAAKLIKNPSDIIPANSYNYHPTWFKPIWRHNLVEYQVIGSHIFYTDKAS